MRAGRLRHRVTIQQLVAASPSQDAGGAPDESWADLVTVWGEVAPLKGRELIAAQQVSSEVTGTITIRYRSGITARMRAVYGSRNYDLLGVVNTFERNRELILYTREGVSVG